MATKSQEILLKGNTTNASAVPSSLKVREIAINALDRSLFTNDGNSIVKLYTGTTKWFDVNGNANNALKLGGILASEYINKEAFNSHINNSIIHITANERTAWNNKWDYNEETIKGVKVNAAVNADKLATARKIWGQSFDGSGDVDGRADFTFDDGQKIIIEKNAGSSNYCGISFFNSGFKVGAITASTLLLNPVFGGNVLIGTTTDNGYKLDVNGKGHYSGDLICGGEVVAVAGEGNPVGVTDYSALTGKPSINGVTLVSGNNTLAALGIQAAGDYATNSGVATLLADYAKKTFISNNYAGKAAFNSHTADTDIHITSAERAAWNAKWNYDEATIKAVKVTSASSADSVAWSGISGKPTTFTPSTHTHTASEVSGLPTKLSAFTNDVGYITSITKSMVEGVLTGDITSHTHNYLPLSGGTISGSIKAKQYIFGDDNDNRVGQFVADDSANNIVYYIDKLWTYNILIHSGNYNSYAPSLTGTGASGTWGINISGNAASATKLQTPRTIWGQSFDGTGNVDGGITIRRTWSTSLYSEGIRVVGASNEWCGVFLGTQDSYSGCQDSQWNILKTNIDTLRICRGPSNLSFFEIIPNGNVLIGTTTDNGYKLQVNGSERVYGNLIVDGEVSALVA